MRETALRRPYDSLDRQVRVQLQKWPHRPPGVMEGGQPGTWLRARPCNDNKGMQPFLKYPGSTHLRTLPDGLWLHFGPDAANPWVDILCIEACGSLANFLDKRSRFAPSTSSLLAVCPLPWLLAAAQETVGRPRWMRISGLVEEPRADLTLPVRHLRVLFGLKAQHYEGFARNQVPQAHEYFCPMEALTAEDGFNNPALRALIGRASVAANFMNPI